MYFEKALLAILLITSALSAWAQAPSSPSLTGDLSSREGTSLPNETYNAGNMPYSAQTNYDVMGGIPQYRAEPSVPGYIGVVGEKWETDKRGRRSTFIHNGQEWSVGTTMPEKAAHADKKPSPTPRLPELKIINPSVRSQAIQQQN